MKAKRAIIIIIICFFVLIAGFIIFYKDAIFQQGNPLPYISKMITLSDNNPFARVFEDQDIYLMRNSNIERFGTGFLVEYIENTYDVTYIEQMGSSVFFDSGEKTIIADIEVYWRYFTIWELAIDLSGGMR